MQLSWMNSMKRLIVTVLILIYFGCGSSVKPPRYTLIEAAGKSPAQARRFCRRRLGVPIPQAHPDPEGCH